MGLLVHEAGRTRFGTDLRRAPLAWQRTDKVGTHMVFAVGPDLVEGAAIVAGGVHYAMQWRALSDGDGGLQDLMVTCRGADWHRTLWMRRATEGWSCRTEETGDLNAHLAGVGRSEQPPPGIDDVNRLDTAAVVRLADSPFFVSWAVALLRLTQSAGATGAPTIRILAPSLAVLPGVSEYHLLSADRLRIAGDEPGSTYDLDANGTVVYQPGRFRIIR